jgi:nucleotide-binding universal stress UspA family protein
MECIVICVDGTPASVAALEWVAARAERRTCRIDVVSVLEWRDGDSEDTLRQLADADAFLRDRVPFATVDLHRASGDVARALAAAASADLLVVGVHPGHGRGHGARGAGAVPLRVSAKPAVPTVLVPTDWMRSRDPITVGVASDDSAATALMFGAEDALTDDLGLRLVHAWRMPVPDVTSEASIARASDEAGREHRALLDGAVDVVRAAYPHLDIESELVREGPGDALRRRSATSSMIVVGTHRHGVVAGLLLGAVAQRLLGRSSCPVAVVPNPSPFAA